MEIKKKKGSFNDYTLDLSYSELVAITNAMADNHSGPIADELYAGLNWYIDRLPEPGDEDEDEKAKRGEPGGDGSPASTDGLDDMLPDTEGPEDQSAPPGGGDGPAPKGKNVFPGASRPKPGGGGGGDDGDDDADGLLSDPDDLPGSKSPPTPRF